MARAPLLQLSGIGHAQGGAALFDDLDLVLHPGDRVALVGRNGAGKSTLMRIMAGQIEPDRGARSIAPGTRIGVMAQEPDFTGFATLGDWAISDLPEGEGWRVQAAAEGLGFDPERPVEGASGGERRRAALARLMAENPDLMLLDEPTNHLDIAAIEWLQARLDGLRGAAVIVSHDRAFLSALTRATVWLDRGQARRREEGFAGFEAWREAVWAEEDAARHKLDRKIRAEARWAVEGISARRKRNQGRLRALAALRAERRAQIARTGPAALELAAGPTSGKRVIEARGLGKSHGGRVVLRDVSLTVQRGDRVALVGPNGAGKTTLLRLLTGQEVPDTGSVTHGTNLALAEFDQNRAALDPEASLWETLTGDPLLGLPGRSDQVMVRGQARHVVGYLKDFLFDDTQARAPVRSLSGGERARLLLARIMARESNLLVLDEPTNDLDVETLDLLQDVLGEYPGTVLLVSHDRDFIDRVATTTLVFQGGGRVTEYAGGWTDALAQGARVGPAAPETAPAAPKAAPPAPARAAKPAQPAAPGLSFAEAHRLARLPDEIARLEAEVAKLAAALADPALFATAPDRAARLTDALAASQAALEAAEADWLDLAERAEAAEQ